MRGGMIVRKGDLRAQCRKCDDLKNCFNYDAEGKLTELRGCRVGERCRIVGGRLRNCIEEDESAGIFDNNDKFI